MVVGGAREETANRRERRHRTPGFATRCIHSSAAIRQRSKLCLGFGERVGVCWLGGLQRLVRRLDGRKAQGPPSIARPLVRSWWSWRPSPGQAQTQPSGWTTLGLSLCVVGDRLVACHAGRRRRSAPFTSSSARRPACHPSVIHRTAAPVLTPLSLFTPCTQQQNQQGAEWSSRAH